MVDSRIGWKDMLTFLPYGEEFHKMRKLTQDPFTRAGCTAYQAIQLTQARILLKNMLQHPEKFNSNCKRCVFFLLVSHGVVMY